jgi:hypothetical protein
VLERPAEPLRHVQTLGEQAGLWGSLQGGFEAWAYPFKPFHGLELLRSGGFRRRLQAPREAPTNRAGFRRWESSVAFRDWLRSAAAESSGTTGPSRNRQLPPATLRQLNTAFPLHARA